MMTSAIPTRGMWLIQVVGVDNDIYFGFLVYNNIGLDFGVEVCTKVKLTCKMQILHGT